MLERKVAIITPAHLANKAGEQPGGAKLLEYSSCIAVQNPEDYEARSNIMRTDTWALNTLIAKGKTTDWMVYMIGQSIGA